MKRKRIVIAIVSVLLVASIAVAAILIIKKANAPLDGYQCNLHEAAALAEMAEFFQSEEMKSQLKAKLKDIDRVDVETLESLELINYLTICRILSLPLDEVSVKTALHNNVNPADGLFSYSIGLNSITTDMSAMLSLLRAYPDVLKYEEFAWEQHILDTIDAFEFKPPERLFPFFSSGATAVLLLDKLREHTGRDFMSHLPENFEEWYAKWKQYYEEQHFSVSNATGCYSVSHAVGKEWPTDRIQDFYARLDSEDDIAYFGANDLVLAKQYLPLVDTEACPEVTQAIKAHITEMIEKHSFVKE